MSALNYDLYIEQGATFQREFTATNPDGSAFSFVGFTVRGTLKANVGSASVSFSTTILDNVILIELTAEQTSALPASSLFSHKYDLEAVSPTGIVYRIAQGNATISAEQTA